MNGLIFVVVLLFSLTNTICVKSINLQSRIINGTQSEPVDYAAEIWGYDEALIKRGTGTLISKRHFLTAANMIYRHDRWILWWGSNYQFFSHTTIGIVHPDYNLATFEHDIGLIEIETDTTVDAIDLPPPWEYIPLANEQGTVRSYGAIYTEPFAWSPILQSSFQRVLENNTCQELLGIRGDLVKDSHFCAMDMDYNSSICLGDEGAGFIIDLNGNKTIAGVVSFYTNMCNPNFPAAFTRVSPYVDWILEYINYT